MILNKLKTIVKDLKQKSNEKFLKWYETTVIDEYIHWMKVIENIEYVVVNFIPCQEIRDGVFQYNKDRKTGYYYCEDRTFEPNYNGLFKWIHNKAIQLGFIEEDLSGDQRDPELKGNKFRVSNLVRKNGYDMVKRFLLEEVRKNLGMEV